jgi:hypothetical protein
MNETQDYPLGWLGCLPYAGWDHESPIQEICEVCLGVDGHMPDCPKIASAE